MAPQTMAGTARLAVAVAAATSGSSGTTLLVGVTVRAVMRSVVPAGVRLLAVLGVAAGGRRERIG